MWPGSARELVESPDGVCVAKDWRKCERKGPTYIVRRNSVCLCLEMCKPCGTCRDDVSFGSRTEFAQAQLDL